MRFVLLDICGDSAYLGTRTTNRRFYTKVSDLIFIKTNHNIQKYDRLRKLEEKSAFVAR